MTEVSDKQYHKIDKEMNRQVGKLYLRGNINKRPTRLGGEEKGK